jgi:hypothetical protein
VIRLLPLCHRIDSINAIKGITEVDIVRVCDPGAITIVIILVGQLATDTTHIGRSVREVTKTIALHGWAC